MSKIGRNDPCPCGSGKKYKNCCLGKKQEQADLKSRLNSLYASIKKVNNDCIDKSNNEAYAESDFFDAMNLSLTSNALSLIKSFFQNNHYAVTTHLI